MLLRISTIIVLGFIAYGCMLQAPFKTMDDRTSIVDNPIIKSTANIPKIFREGYFHDQHYYRPLVNLTFMAEYQVFGLKSFYYNLDNLLLHILNALLVFLLVSRLTKAVQIGYWTALLFVIHPVQWEAVCNIPGRAILLSAFFVLSTFILFLAYYKNRRWEYLFLAAIAFSLGLLCKESTGVLPAVLLVYLILDKTKAWIHKIMSLWPLFIGIISYILLRHYLGITKNFQADNPYETILGFVTFLRSVITDLRLFLLPIDLHFDRSLAFFMSLAYPPALMTIAFWGIVIITLYFLRQKIDAFVFFLIFWFVLELLPVSQLVAGIGVGAGRVSTAEHFLYLACIPFFIGMVIAFRWFCEKNNSQNYIKPVFLKVLAGGFLAFLLLIAIEQSIYASSELMMLERSLSFQPDNPRIQGAMGMLSVFRNDIPEAEKHFRAAVKAEPTNASYHISLGTALCQQGKWIECLAQYVSFDAGKDKASLEAQKKLTMAHIQEQLVQGKTFDSQGWLTIGVYFAETGQVGPALNAFTKSVNLDPQQTNAWQNLGSLHEALGDKSAAKEAYLKLLELPQVSQAQKDFALRHLAMMGGR